MYVIENWKYWHCPTGAVKVEAGHECWGFTGNVTSTALTFSLLSDEQDSPVLYICF